MGPVFSLGARRDTGVALAGLYEVDRGSGDPDLAPAVDMAVRLEASSAASALKNKSDFLKF
jgi:hypothetical protein